MLENGLQSSSGVAIPQLENKDISDKKTFK